MGTVYEATDERFESQVALKQTHFTEEGLRRQFEREARLLNKLRHPAMTRVIDYFSEADNQFLVMDYVPGEDLGAMLESNGGRPLPMDDVFSWGDQLLDALDYIHSQNPPIIHRDIKPQNLKLTERNRIILLDFGLAKGSVGGMTTVATTRSVLGYSLAYAPLEQILKVEGHWIELLSVSNAEEVEKILTKGTDPRSDLYSLAATMLHLMTGKPPPNAPTRALSVWTGRPDSLYAALSHGVSREVGEVLTRAMTLTLDERFASAEEMREALRKAHRPPTQRSSEARTETVPPTIVELPLTQRAPQQESAPPPSTVASLQEAGKPISTIASPVTPRSEVETLLKVSQPSRPEAQAVRRKSAWRRIALTLLFLLLSVGASLLVGLATFLITAKSLKRPESYFTDPDSSLRAQDYLNSILSAEATALRVAYFVGIPLFIVCVFLISKWYRKARKSNIKGGIAHEGQDVDQLKRP
ncbi:MAG: eukaryotic-like serine/threonine-protein kinase [Acidobacteriota bacterium]|nr:eukaryotic-like serine/threonine-protein kinase [Acidobacteriota bacterium]